MTACIGACPVRLIT
ncbi:hypothetical protein LINGRAHAP2_LOCUS3063 [Linum grandiflorum]